MPSQIALQLYTLRDFLKTPADILATLKRVKKIGYDAVQASGLGPIEPAELARILAGEGLTCAATHVGLDRLQTDLPKLLEEHHLLGCKYTAIGGNFWKDATPAEWLAFAHDFSLLADAAATGGLQLGYHHHSHEFIRPGLPPAGPFPMDTLLTHCSKSVWFEIDTYWVQHGGADPAAWIDKVAYRVPVVHLKDMNVVRSPDGKVTPQMAEVGEGNINFPRILESCQRARVQWYCIEQDTCQRDPFESITISLRNLKALGIH